MAERIGPVALLALATTLLFTVGEVRSAERGKTPHPPAGRQTPRTPDPGTGALPGPEETLSRAARTAATIPDGEHRALSLALVAAQQWKAGAHSTASLIFRDAQKATQLIRGKGAREARLEDIAEVQAEAGDVDGAFRTGTLVQSELYRDSTLFKIARAQARAGRLEAARRTAARQRLYETEPTAEALGLAFAGAQRIPEALKVAEPLEGADRSSVLTAVALAQVRAGDRMAAAATFQQSRAAALASTVPIFRNERLAELAEAMARSDFRNEALDAVEQIADPERKVLALVAVSGVLAHAGQFSRAREIVDRLPAGRSRAHGLAVLAQEQEGRGEHPAAVETVTQAIQAMGDARIRVGGILVDVAGNLAYLELGKAEVAVGDLAGAERSVQALRMEQHRATLLKEIAMARYRTGDRVGGAAAFREARNAAAGIVKSPYDRERGTLLTAITVAQCHMGDPRAAWAGCAELKDPVDRVSALLGFATAGPSGVKVNSIPAGLIHEEG